MPLKVLSAEININLKNSFKCLCGWIKQKIWFLSFSVSYAEIDKADTDRYKKHINHFDEFYGIWIIS